MEPDAKGAPLFLEFAGKCWGITAVTPDCRRYGVNPCVLRVMSYGWIGSLPSCGPAFLRRSSARFVLAFPAPQFYLATLLDVEDLN